MDVFDRLQKEDDGAVGRTSGPGSHRASIDEARRRELTRRPGQCTISAWL
jgi:hypothetical protein